MSVFTPLWDLLTRIITVNNYSNSTTAFTERFTCRKTFQNDGYNTDFQKSQN